MNRYRVMWDYVSGFGGPWVEGEVVELTVEEARTINVDSPGVLEVATEKGGRETGSGAARQGKKKSDRMVKKAAEDRNE